MQPKTLTWAIRLIGIFGLLVIAGVLLHYRSHFGSELSNEQTVWGLFSDYIGGLVGTILAFLSLIALLFNIAAQLREAREARMQMEAMKIAQEKSTDIAELTALFELEERYSRFLKKWCDVYNENSQQGEKAVEAKKKTDFIRPKLVRVESKIESYSENKLFYEN